MANPLFEAFGNNAMNNQYAEIIKQAKELQKTFKGNPKDTVQQLLNSGQMSQQDFNRYSQIAQQIVPFLK